MCKLKYFRAKSDPDSTERHIFTMGWTAMTLCLTFFVKYVKDQAQRLVQTCCFCRKWINVIPLFCPPDIM